MASKTETNRLETPVMAGFRSGMSSCMVIGRKLGRVYSVPSDRPDSIDALIQEIDRTVYRARSR